jgi:hypothetical protein
MGYTYGGQFVLYFTIQVVVTFGFITQVHQRKPVTTLGFLVGALVFSWLTYVFCNAAHRTTKLVRNAAACNLSQFLSDETVLCWAVL